jgi:hypothetical protein
MKPNELDPIKQIVREHRALAILRIVNRQPGRAANELVLAECLRAFALTCGHEELRAEIDGLERTGLLQVEQVTGPWVVELTRRGAEVADGIVAVEGVARVEPNCCY